jgi:hypothetical protein
MAISHVSIIINLCHIIVKKTKLDMWGVRPPNSIVLRIIPSHTDRVMTTYNVLHSTVAMNWRQVATIVTMFGLNQIPDRTDQWLEGGFVLRGVHPPKQSAAGLLKSSSTRWTTRRWALASMLPFLTLQHKETYAFISRCRPPLDAGPWRALASRE